ncbi:MAG: hypothetical protein K5841_06225 [Fretibacterium sp.]|nr:hypothetical protein [Fretibacterium sp.]
MKSLKMSVIAVLVIGTLSLAGTAFASHGRGGRQGWAMGPFGGHHSMRGQQWNGGENPSMPRAGSEDPRGFGPMEPRGPRGPMGPMERRMGSFPQMGGQGFNGQCFALRGGPAFGNRGWQYPCMGNFQPCPGFMPDRFCGFGGMGFGHGRGPAFRPEARGPRGEYFPHRGDFSRDMPQEIRAKTVEAAKLRIDLEDVLSRRPLDRKKAVELNSQIDSLRQEIRTWRFQQKLDRIEEFNRQSAQDAGKPEVKESK